MITRRVWIVAALAALLGPFLLEHTARAQDSDWVRLGTISTKAPPANFQDFRVLFDRYPAAQRAHVMRFHDGRSAVGVAIMDVPDCAFEDMEPQTDADGTTAPKLGCPVVVGLAEPRSSFLAGNACFFSPEAVDEAAQRRNGTYARFESRRGLVEIRTIKDGQPVADCDAMFSVRAN